MTLDRIWMYRRISQDFISIEFKDGVDEFIAFAFSNRDTVDEKGRIRCSCSICNNCRFYSEFDVLRHLYTKGFVSGYTTWTLHGECFYEQNNENESGEVGSDMYAEMIFDTAGPKLHSHVEEEIPNETAARFYNLVQVFCVVSLSENVT